MPNPLRILPALLVAAVAASGRPALPTTIPVTTAVDADAGDGLCSLREAILAANTDAAYRECPAGGGADRIVFDLPLPAAIDLGSDLPPVTASVAIRGPGADQLAIDGQDLHRLFYLLSPAGGAWYLLEDLSLQHGLADDALGDFGGGVYVGPGDTVVLSRVVIAENTAANAGGGVAVDGLVGLPAAAEIEQSIVTGNRALGPAGGGGVLVVDSSTATISASSLVDNRAEHENAGGGGLNVQRGFVVVTRSTVSGNSAYDGAGGIRASASNGDSALTLIDSTVSNNIADVDLVLDGNAGGIWASSTSTTVLVIEIVNSIVAGNHDDGAIVYPDFQIDSFVTLISSGFNLIGVNEGASAAFAAGSPNANGDFVGTAAAPIDPLLEALALNQAVTLSHRPVLDAASPVIDQGACPGRSADQRGRGVPSTHLRAFDHPTVPTHAASDGCDIGAVERGASADSAAELFLDGFELGHALRWSAEAP